MKKKASSKKKTSRKSMKRVKAVTLKARALVDEQLATISPALKKKIADLKGQLTVGDLRMLGMNVLEQARALSEKLRQQAKVKPAMRKGKMRASKSAKAAKK